MDKCTATSIPTDIKSMAGHICCLPMEHGGAHVCDMHSEDVLWLVHPVYGVQAWLMEDGPTLHAREVLNTLWGPDGRYMNAAAAVAADAEGEVWDE